MSEVIAFFSGKGGTGKSALCAGVATALATTGQKVLCVDADVGLGNLDIFLGLESGAALSFLDICRGNYKLTAAAVHPIYPNLSFLAAPISGSWADISTPAFAGMLEDARNLFDYILIDGPAGLAGGMKCCAQCADRCVVVTLPDRASIRCAQRAGQELELLGAKNVRLVVNRIFNEMLKVLKMNIDDIMDAAGLPLLGVVPSDPDVSFAAAAGKPLLRHSRFGAAAAYKRIAKRIQGFPIPVSG